MNGKNLTAKTPPGDFKVTTFEIPLLSQQAVISKEIPSTLSTYSWTLTTIPNWTCSIVIISPFDAWLPNTWLTNVRIPVRDFKYQLEKIVGYKVFQFIPMMTIKKMLGHKTLWCKYTATSSRVMNYGKILSPGTICLNRVCSILVQLVNSLTALKIIFLYV